MEWIAPCSNLFDGQDRQVQTCLKSQEERAAAEETHTGSLAAPPHPSGWTPAWGLQRRSRSRQPKKPPSQTQKLYRAGFLQLGFQTGACDPAWGRMCAQDCRINTTGFLEYLSQKQLKSWPMSLHNYDNHTQNTKFK